MRLLADENFPGNAVSALRTQGYDVVWMHTDAPGSPDTAVVARANTEDRIIITFDKDFGELAFREGLAVTSGIILFRLPPASPTFVAQAALKALESRTDWAGHFSVIEPGLIRMTPLPPKTGANQQS